MSETINLTASNASLTVTDASALPVLTSGMQNHVLCHFTFADAWNGLQKAATFRAGDRRVSILEDGWLDGATVAVPPEVLAASGYRVHVGLYGYSGTPDNIILPTVEACIGEVKAGTDPNAETPGQPTPQIWEQIKHDIGDLSDLDTEAKSSIVAAINEAYSHGGGGTLDHRQLTNRDAEGQHPISAITGLQSVLDGKLPKNIILNVMDYGAAGDGETSDSDSIQDALNACNTAGGGTVYFPKGTYLLDKPVKFYSNQYLLGEIGATLLQADMMTDDKIDSDYCNLLRNYNNGGGGYTVTHDVVIDGLTFDGGTQEEAATTLLTFCHSQNITVKNCRFTNGFSNATVGNGHDIECNSSKNVLIENCVHSENRRTNFASELIQIDIFRLQAMYPWLPDSGTNQNVDGTACDNVSVHGCEFYGSNVFTPSGNSAIGNHDNGSNNINITNCKFNGFYMGIKPRECTNQIVANNLFMNCLFGVITIAMEASKDCTILANVFVNCTYIYERSVSSSRPVGFNNYVDGELYERLTSLDDANDITVPSSLAVKNYVGTATNGLASEAWVQNQGYLAASATPTSSTTGMQDVYRDATTGKLVTPAGGGGGAQVPLIVNLTKTGDVISADRTFAEIYEAYSGTETMAKRPVFARLQNFEYELVIATARIAQFSAPVAGTTSTLILSPNPDVWQSNTLSLAGDEDGRSIPIDNFHYPTTAATQKLIAAAIGDTAGALTSLDSTLDGLDALIGGDSE